MCVCDNYLRNDAYYTSRNGMECQKIEMYIVTVNNFISDDDEQKDLIPHNNDDLSTTILLKKKIT